MKKQMKQRQKLAGVLALCMLLALCPIVQAVGVEDAVPIDVGNRAFAKMNALGIFNEDSYDGSVQMDRGTFTRLVMQLGGDVPAILNPGDTVFADVDAETENSDYIAAAYRLGYISGEADGYFYPQDTITAAAAVKLAIGVLGYGVYAEQNGGFPAGYLKIANRLDLLDGLDVNPETSLTWAHAMVLLDNVSMADLMQIVRIGATVEMQTIPGETLLSERFSIYQTEAVIDANEYSHLLAPDSDLAPGTVSAGGTIFRAGNTGAADYLGMDMEIYYRADDGMMPELLYVRPSMDNRTLELNSEDVMSMEQTTLTYEDAEARQKDARLSTSVVLIWNGKMAERTQEKVMPDCGTVTLISNNGDQVYDVISVMSYTSYVVSGVSVEIGSVSTKQGRSLELDYNDSSYDLVIKMDDQIVGLDSIQAEQVISYAESEAVGTVLKTVLISTKTITGTVEEVNSTERQVVLNGSTYRFDPELDDSLTPGKDGTFYLDVFDHLVYIDGTLDIVYGYLNGIDVGIFGIVQCRIFTENNRWVTLQMNSRVRCNGQSVTASEAVNQLGKKENYRQLIRYLVDAKGRITRVDTAESITMGTAADKQAIADDTFRMTASGTMPYRTTTNSFNGVVTVEGDAKFFIINGTDEDDITLGGRELLQQDQNYDFEAYDTDMYRASKVFVVKNYTKPLNTGNSIASMLLVKGIGTSLNANMEPRDAVFGYYKGMEVALPVNLDENSSIKSVLELNPGDLIQFNVNDEEELNTIVRRYSAGTEFSISPSSVYHSQSFVTAEVLAVNVAGSRLVLQYAADGSAAVYSISGLSTVYIYETDTETFINGTVADIMTGDTVVTSARYFVCKELFVIR